MRPQKRAIGTAIVVVVVVVIIGIATVSYTMLTSTSHSTTTPSTIANTSTSATSSSTSSASSSSAITTTSTTTRSTSMVYENCPANYNGFGSADENQTYPVYPVLSMPVNSTGEVCLTYHNPTNTTQTIPISEMEIGYFSAQPTGSGIDKGYNISFNASSDFTSVPNATSITLAPNASQTVAFLVHSDADSKGFYYLGAPAGSESCSMGMPLAVGYTFTAQNKSGAYWNPEGAEWNCVTWSSPMVYSTILGFVGIQQTYVGCGGYICDQASSYGTFSPRP